MQSQKLIWERSNEVRRFQIFLGLFIKSLPFFINYNQIKVKNKHQIYKNYVLIKKDNDHTLNMILNPLIQIIYMQKKNYKFICVLS